MLPVGSRPTGCIIAPVNAAVGRARGRRLAHQARARRARSSAAGSARPRATARRLFEAPGPLLAVTEGVEDALAYRELSGVPTWAALNAGNMVELVLPARFTEVQVVADVDDVGMQRAREAVLRLRREGRDARLIRPIAAKDANDVLRARRLAG